VGNACLPRCSIPMPFAAFSQYYAMMAAAYTYSTITDDPHHPLEKMTKVADPETVLGWIEGDLRARLA
jgi:hypothetical protein